MSGSTALNLANYTTVWDDNFATDTSLNTSIWSGQWGNADDFAFGNGGLTITSYASEGWTNAGIIQQDNSATAAQGYGLYSATFSTDDGQGIGPCICLWPSTNNWPGPEIDFYEDWSGSSARNTGYMTVHWEGSGDSNQYQTYQYSANFTQPTTIAMDWESNSLTFYVNGQEVVQYTAGGSVPIPQDAADGGQNESFSAEVTAASSAPISSSVSLTLYNMSYAAYTPGTGTGSGTGTGTTTPTISVSSPGTVQEASVGAGVTVAETITATGLTTVDYMVMTSANVGEQNWQVATLSANGVATVNVDFEHTGDYLLVENNPTAESVEASSTPITITDPSTTTTTTTPAITGVSAPGTVQEASVGAGVTVAETITASGLTTVDYFVMTSANVAEENWQVATLNASGVATVDVEFEHTGDYLLVVNNPTTESVKAWSDPITITDPSSTVTDPPAGPANVKLTGDNLNGYSPAWTVVGTLSSTDALAVTYTMGTNPGGLFAISGDQLLLDENMPSDAPSDYAISVIATDSAGGTTTKALTVGVGSVSGGTTGALASATDSTGTTASLSVIKTGKKTFATATTGLKGAVTESVSHGIDTFSTAAGSGVTGVSVVDSAGGSYGFTRFGTVEATLGGASSGHISVSGASVAQISLGAGNYVASVTSAITAANVTFSGGSGNDVMAFVGAGTANFIGGAGADTIVCGSGTNEITFGTGTSLVWAGGTDDFVFHAGSGLQVIQDFLATSDTLSIATSLESGLKSTVTGGNTLLTLGGATHGIELVGVSSFNTAQIHWF
jgi:hypothetical protein